MPILYRAKTHIHALSRNSILQEIPLRIMNFQSRDSLSSLLFKSNHILKLEGKILIENILFINKSFNNLFPPNFKSWFTFRMLLMFPIIKQCHLLQTRYLNHFIKLILMEKFQSL